MPSEATTSIAAGVVEGGAKLFFIAGTRISWPGAASGASTSSDGADGGDENGHSSGLGHGLQKEISACNVLQKECQYHQIC